MAQSLKATSASRPPQLRSSQQDLAAGPKEAGRLQKSLPLSADGHPPRAAPSASLNASHTQAVPKLPTNISLRPSHLVSNAPEINASHVGTGQNELDDATITSWTGGEASLPSTREGRRLVVHLSRGTNFADDARLKTEVRAPAAAARQRISYTANMRPSFDQGFDVVGSPLVAHGAGTRNFVTPFAPGNHPGLPQQPRQHRATLGYLDFNNVEALDKGMTLMRQTRHQSLFSAAPISSPSWNKEWNRLAGLRRKLQPNTSSTVAADDLSTSTAANTAANRLINATGTDQGNTKPRAYPAQQRRPLSAIDPVSDGRVDGWTWNGKVLEAKINMVEVAAGQQLPRRAETALPRAPGRISIASRRPETAAERIMDAPVHLFKESGDILPAPPPKLNRFQELKARERIHGSHVKTVSRYTDICKVLRWAEVDPKSLVPSYVPRSKRKRTVASEVVMVMTEDAPSNTFGLKTVTGAGNLPVEPALKPRLGARKPRRCHWRPADTTDDPPIPARTIISNLAPAGLSPEDRAIYRRTLDALRSAHGRMARVHRLSHEAASRFLVDVTLTEWLIDPSVETPKLRKSTATTTVGTPLARAGGSSTAPHFRSNQLLSVEPSDLPQRTVAKLDDEVVSSVRSRPLTRFAKPVLPGCPGASVVDALSAQFLGFETTASRIASRRPRWLPPPQSAERRASDVPRMKLKLAEAEVAADCVPRQNDSAVPAGISLEEIPVASDGVSAFAPEGSELLTADHSHTVERELPAAPEVEQPGDEHAVPQTDAPPEPGDDERSPFPVTPAAPERTGASDLAAEDEEPLASWDGEEEVGDPAVGGAARVVITPYDGARRVQWEYGDVAAVSSWEDPPGATGMQEPTPITGGL
ncbi:hypothetical protein HK405_006160 [Cladochytrium tenue]|nr:hypothetical protein HK405_006160 [Cladochytrium tenue]